MKRFLAIFTGLLGCIGLVSLLVGGIGITNMMLVSVAERYRELGLRKAIGATNRSLWLQTLLESIVVCGIAGVLGLGLGFVGYEGAIYAGSKLVDKLQFEWIVDWNSLLIATVSILLVGIFSGLIPALRARKLQVIDAMRAE